MPGITCFLKKDFWHNEHKIRNNVNSILLKEKTNENNLSRKKRKKCWKISRDILAYEYSNNFRCPNIYYWAASWQNQQNDCAPSEDSDQPGHPPSLNRVFAQISLGIRPVRSESLLCTQWVAKDPSFLHGTAKTLIRMPRLFWVFAGRTYHFVDFVMRQLDFNGTYVTNSVKEGLLNNLTALKSKIYLPEVSVLLNNGTFHCSHCLSQLTVVGSFRTVFFAQQ